MRLIGYDVLVGEEKDARTGVGGSPQRLQRDWNSLHAIWKVMEFLPVPGHRMNDTTVAT